MTNSLSPKYPVSGGSMSGHVDLYFTPHFPGRKRYKAREEEVPAEVALLLADEMGVSISRLFH